MRLNVELVSRQRRAAGQLWSDERLPHWIQVLLVVMLRLWVLEVQRT